MPKLTTNCNTGQIHLLLRHRLYRGWYSCGLVRLLLFGLIHIPDSFRKIQKWLFRQIICRRNWYFYQSLLQSEHTVIVSIHDNSIPTATVLAFMPANASIAQAGIFVSLNTPRDTNNSKALTSRPVTFLKSPGSSYVITSFKERSRYSVRYMKPGMRVANLISSPESVCVWIYTLFLPHSAHFSLLK